MDRKAIFGAISLAFLALPQASTAATALSVSSPFSYTFSSPGILEESKNIEDSSSPYFWLVSGGKLILEDGLGKTISGPLISDPWKNTYSKKNFIDTDGGQYPQNVFRLITRSEWQDYSQEVTFKVLKTNITDSYNRDAFSGFFLFSKYKSENSYYYAGIRMDGQAVIKKKLGNSFYTLGSVQVFGDAKNYKKDSNPTLIPQNKVMRLRLITKDLSETASEFILAIDKGDGNWINVLDITDKNALRGTSYAGIESDFMDVVIDNYTLAK